jgi:hypothetical protein
MIKIRGEKKMVHWNYLFFVLLTSITASGCYKKYKNPENQPLMASGTDARFKKKIIMLSKKN